jgi:hypothetical protein
MSKTFLTVYQMGSYTQAAEQLFLPQPTISQRISQLDKQLGSVCSFAGKEAQSLQKKEKHFCVTLK